MAKDVHTSREKRYCLSASINDAATMTGQTVWGTGVGAGDNFVGLDCESTTVDRDIQEREINVNHQSRNEASTSIAMHTDGSTPMVELELDAKQDEIDVILYLMMQTVSEAAGTPYAKTLTFDAGQPDFTVNAGYFATFGEVHPADADSGILINDCIGEKLTFTISPNGILMMNTTLKGREMVDTFTPSGDITTQDQDFYYYSKIAVFTIDDGASSDIEPHGDIELSLEQTVEPIGSDGAGSVETFGLINRTLTFKFKALHTGDIGETFYDAYKNNTLCDFRLGWGHATPGTDDGDLDFAWKGKITNCTDPNDDVATLEVEGTMLWDASGAVASPLTVIIANDKDRAW